MPRTEYILRAGRSTDVPAVDRLLGRSYPRLLRPDYPPSVLVTAIPIIARAQPALVACGSYYLAVSVADGAVLGAGGWTRHDPATGRAAARVGSIRHFATDPGYLRQGIAGALLAHCLREARAAGVQRMICLSTRTAVGFYESAGFAALAEVAINLRPGISMPAIRMERALGWGA